MAKKRLTEGQIADMLKMYQGDTPIGEIVKKFGLSSDTIHKYRERAGIPKRTQAESVALWRQAMNISHDPRPPRKIAHAEDVPCGWDGESVTVKVSPGEVWCRECWESLMGGFCVRCGTGGVPTVKAVDVLRVGEWVTA